MSYSLERSRKIHAEFANILGVDHFGQAVRKLNRIILLELGKKIKKDRCLGCKQIVAVDNFTLAHIEPWRRCWTREGNKELFWNIDNIALAHSGCNTTDNTRSDDKIIYEAPEEYECNKNVKDPTHRTQLNFDYSLLGMEFGKANHQLFRKVMFTWAEKAGMNHCKKCTKPIKDIKDWTVEHIKPWFLGSNDEERKNLFYDFGNIGFSHLHCNSATANLGKGKSGYNGVDWYENKKTGYGTWRARIKVGKDHKTLKHSKNPIECAEAYDMGVLKYRNGEGVLNFPEKVQQYQEQIDNGWNEPLKCKKCGDKHFGLGYCRKHHYELCGGKEKRKERYIVKGE